MHHLINSYMVTSSLIAGQKLNIFRLIVNNPLTIDQLCSAVGCSSVEKIIPLIDYLCANNFLTRVRDIYYPNQYTLELADPTKPYGLMLNIIADQYLPASLMIGDAILSNQTAYELAHGKSVWDHRKYKSRLGDDFQKYIDIQARVIAKELVKSWNWFEYQNIIDIGGGSGALASAIKLAYPEIKVDLFETAEQCGRIHNFYASKEIICDELVEGDFFNNIPSGYGAYVLKSVLHDWTDSNCLLILEKITMAAEGADLVIIERVLTDRSDDVDIDVDLKSYLVDQSLLMLMLHGSRERTREEWGAIFNSAKLILVQEKNLECGFCIFRLRANF